MTFAFFTVGSMSKYFTFGLKMRLNWTKTTSYIFHIPVALLSYMNLTWFCTLIQRQVQGKTSRNIYLIKFQDFPGYWEPCKQPK